MKQIETRVEMLMCEESGLAALGNEAHVLGDDNGGPPDGTVLLAPAEEFSLETVEAVRSGRIPECEIVLGAVYEYDGTVEEQSFFDEVGEWCGFSSRGEAYITDTSLRNMRGSKLHSMDLARNDFSRSDLSEADFGFSNLSESDFSSCDLRNSSLRNTKAQFTDFRFSDLRGVDARRADFTECYMDCADLRGADLREAIFKDAILCGADLRGADIDFANFSLGKSSLGIVMDYQQKAQIAYHFLSLRQAQDEELSDVQRAKLAAAREALLPLANDWEGLEYYRLHKIEE